MPSKEKGLKSATTPPTRRDRRRLETREKLYRIAMELFAKRGYFETTTEHITTAADVGQGTFFNYFPTKSHVLLALSEKQLGKVGAAAHEAEKVNSSIHDVLRRFIHNIVEEFAKSPALARSLLTIFVSQEDVRTLMGNTLALGREGLAKVCEIGQERGEIRKDRKAADLAMTFQRNVLGTLLIWTMQPKGDLHVWLDRTLEDFWDMAGTRKR